MEEETPVGAIVHFVSFLSDKILNQGTGHLKLFSNDDWANKYCIISYGHDIEIFWFIHGAALVLDDKTVLLFMKHIAAAVDERLTFECGMIYETFLDRYTILMPTVIGRYKQKMW
ncbi:hypothetical protein [uncultured Bacteroides sp.]|uniref:hypothetical protein n=1 Tax=uncultured Bacteroides sp. TaxID=162156 RepID=UPI003749E03F